MSKRYYFPNRILIDKHIPFIIQITSGLTVYYQKSGSNQLLKADSILHKKTHFLNISIDDYNIIVKDLDKKGNCVYTIKHKGVELKDEKNG